MKNPKLSRKKIFSGIFYFLFFISSKITFAQSRSGGEFELPNPLGTSSIMEIINRVIDYLILYIGPPILTIMILYGAFQILTAADKPEKFSSGKKTILYAVIGYGILLLAKGVEFLVRDLIK